MSTDTKAGFTTEIPMTFRRRGGKAVIVLPDGSRAIERREALIDNAMVKLLARGHRWHRKLFDGTHASIEDMAKSENISPSFVSRILRLAYHPGREVPGAPNNEGSDGAVPHGLVYAGEDIFAAKVEAKTAFISCAPTQIRTKWISG